MKSERDDSLFLTKKYIGQLDEKDCEGVISQTLKYILC